MIVSDVNIVVSADRRLNRLFIGFVWIRQRYLIRGVRTLPAWRFLVLDLVKLEINFIDIEVIKVFAHQ